MKILTEKLDYDLFVAMFIEQDEEKVQTMWENICKNSGFLIDAIQIDNVTNGMCPTFRAPMICFMMLKFPNTVPRYLYEKLVDTVIRRTYIANSIYVGGIYLDFLSLILANNEYMIPDYQKERILNMVQSGYGLEEEKRFVTYDELLEMDSPVVAKLVAGDLEILVNEYAYESFQDGEVKHIGISRKYKGSIDYRSNIITNSSFSENEKAYVLERINQDEQEFVQFMNYFVSQIVVRHNLDRNIIIAADLKDISVDELQEQFKDNEELLKDLLFAKKLCDKHYQKESNLVRKIN